MVHGYGVWGCVCVLEMLEETGVIIGGLEELETFAEILSSLTDHRDLGTGSLLDLILVNLYYYFYFCNSDVLLAQLLCSLSMGKIGNMGKKQNEGRKELGKREIKGK